MQEEEMVGKVEDSDSVFASAFEGMSQSLIDADKVFPLVPRDQGYAPDVKEWVSGMPYVSEFMLTPFDDPDLDRLRALLTEGEKGPGSMIIVTSGDDTAFQQMQMRMLADNDERENLWPCRVISADEFEPPADVTEDDRPQVMILSASGRNNVGLNAAIAAVLSKAFDVREERIGFGHTRNVPTFEPDMFFFPTCYDMEFRWTPLHLKLSLEATKVKQERQQQRRKALFKFHQQKRAKRGKEHAKQKHKGIARFR